MRQQVRSGQGPIVDASGFVVLIPHHFSQIVSRPSTFPFVYTHSAWLLKEKRLGLIPLIEEAFAFPLSAGQGPVID